VEKLWVHLLQDIGYYIFIHESIWKNSTAQLLTDSEISDSRLTTFSGTKELPNPSWTTEVKLKEQDFSFYH
jgi:hypothetical protein